MRLDYENEFAQDTTVALAAGTHTLGNDIDIVKNGSAASNLYAYANIAVAATSGGSATLNFKILNDTAVGFGTAVTIAESGAIAVADLVAGYEIFKQRLPKNLKRYLRLQVIVAVATVTAGTVNSGLVDGIDHAEVAN